MEMDRTTVFPTHNEQMTAKEIKDMLVWGNVYEVNTPSGPKKLKKATPTPKFWEIYKIHKTSLATAGITVSKYQNTWSVCWWSQADGEFHEEVKLTKVEDTPSELVLDELRYVNGILGYQIKPVQMTCASLKTYYACLLAHTTGVGKTFITLAAIRERLRSAIVICPKTIVTDWHRAADYMGVELKGVYGWEWIKTGKTEFGDWEIEKRYNARKMMETSIKTRFVWNIPSGCDLVFDEIHRAAGLDTYNSMIVINAKQQQKEIDEDYQKFGIYGLSATIANDPTKMKAIGFCLGLHMLGKNFHSWMFKHGVKQTRFGPKFIGKAFHLKLIHKDIFPFRGNRIRSEDLGDDFPETQIIAKAYDMSESKQIADVYAEMQSRIEELAMEEHNAMANILVEILRARQRVELLKLPLFIDLAQDAMDDGNSVFLAVNFKETLRALVDKLKIKAVIVGGQTDNERRGGIDMFQRNDTNIIAGIIKACREGLNLHDIHGGHPRFALIMPTQSAFDLKQVLGRTHRAGGKTPSIQRIVFAAKTIEESVCEGLATKLDQLDLLCDGDLAKGIFPDRYSSMRESSEE